MLSKIAFCLTVSAKLLALSCSNPITLSSPDQEIVGDSEVITNARGDFTAYWKLTDVEGEKIQVAIKPKDGAWLPFTTVMKEDGASVKDLILDDSGNIDIFLVKGCCGNKTLHWANKKWGEPWSNVSELSASRENMRKGLHLPYQKGMSVAMNKSRGDNFTDFLGFILWDKTSGTCFVKPVADIYFIHSPAFGLNKQRTVCAVWSQHEKVQGWLAQTDQYSLEAAWLREGAKDFVRERVCTFEKKTYTSNSKIAIDPKENATVVWRVDEKIQAASRVEGKWNGPVDIASSVKNLAKLEVGCDEEGNALAVWVVKAEKKGAIWSAYKPLGGTWTTPVEISSPGGNNLFFTLAHDHAGYFVVVWNYGAKLMIDSIYGVTFSTKDQKWSTPKRLSPDGQICKASSVAFSESGKGYLNWINVTNQKDVKVQVAEIFTP